MTGVLEYIPQLLRFLCANLLHFRGRNSFRASRSEFFNASCGINEFLFAREERMTCAADIELEFRPSCPYHKGDATGARDLGFREVLGMDIRFHTGHPSTLFFP